MPFAKNQCVSPCFWTIEFGTWGKHDASSMPTLSRKDSGTDKGTGLTRRSFVRRASWVAIRFWWLFDICLTTYYCGRHQVLTSNHVDIHRPAIGTEANSPRRVIFLPNWENNQVNMFWPNWGNTTSDNKRLWICSLFSSGVMECYALTSVDQQSPAKINFLRNLVSYWIILYIYNSNYIICHSILYIYHILYLSYYISYHLYIYRIY